MKDVKVLITTIICVTVTIIVVVNYQQITDTIANFLFHDPKITLKPGNEYAKNKDYLFVKQSVDFHPYNYQELLDIYYTVFDKGWDQFTFYCAHEYTDCIKDVESLSNNQVLLSYINNLVSPYNSFLNVYTSYDETGEITIKINKLYNDEQIKFINTEIEKIINENINSQMSDEDKIKKIHDYIVNNTKYDQSVNESNKLTDSSNAYGLLKNHLATCNGYSDVMALILNKLNINNYKIATAPTQNKSGHVWNAVYVNGKWLHLDLTWDDPVGQDGKDHMNHKYFLIDNKALLDADSGAVTIDSHNFKPSIYLEFKD